MMANSFLTSVFIFGIVSCEPFLANDGIGPTQMNKLIKNITLNVTINNPTESNSYLHNVTFKDVEDIINGSGQEYLDKLLINTHIGHKLDFDFIEEKSKNKLIVGLHVTLTGDTITNNTDNNNNINIDDFQNNIQFNSDNKLGKNVVNFKINHAQRLTTSNPMTTDEKYTHSFLDHHEPISILLILIILIFVTLLTFCIGCIVIIFYLKRIRNEQKQSLQKINSNSSMNDNINIHKNDNMDAKEIAADSNKNVQKNIVVDTVDKRRECEILVSNHVNNCIGEDSYAMTDSEQLYRDTTVIIPGVDDNTIGNKCITPY